MLTTDCSPRCRGGYACSGSSSSASGVSTCDDGHTSVSTPLRARPASTRIPFSSHASGETTIASRAPLSLSSILEAERCQLFPVSGNSIVSEWTGRMLSNLPDPCIDWLTVHFASDLPDQHRRQVIKRIAPIYQTDNIDAQQAKQYSRFTHSLSKESLANTEIRSHFDQTLDQIRQRHNNPNDYLRRVFPAIPPILGSASPGQVGPMLNELFANTKGDPSLFGCGCKPNRRRGWRLNSSSELYRRSQRETTVLALSPRCSTSRNRSAPRL